MQEMLLREIGDRERKYYRVSHLINFRRWLQRARQNRWLRWLQFVEYIVAAFSTDYPICYSGLECILSSDGALYGCPWSPVDKKGTIWLVVRVVGT